jgi:hypothetical protein
MFSFQQPYKLTAGQAETKKRTFSPEITRKIRIISSLEKVGYPNQPSQTDHKFFYMDSNCKDPSAQLNNTFSV